MLFILSVNSTFQSAPMSLYFDLFSMTWATQNTGNNSIMLRLLLAIIISLYFKLKTHPFLFGMLLAYQMHDDNETSLYLQKL